MPIWYSCHWAESTEQLSYSPLPVKCNGKQSFLKPNRNRLYFRKTQTEPKPRFFEKTEPKRKFQIRTPLYMQRYLGGGINGHLYTQEKVYYFFSDNFCNCLTHHVVFLALTEPSMTTRWHLKRHFIPCTVVQSTYSISLQLNSCPKDQPHFKLFWCRQMFSSFLWTSRGDTRACAHVSTAERMEPVVAIESAGGSFHERVRLRRIATCAKHYIAAGSPQAAVTSFVISHQTQLSRS